MFLTDAIVLTQQLLTMKRLILLVLCLCVCYVASAQRLATGVVVDESDQPIIGVMVSALGASSGTTTDIEGRFRLELRVEVGQLQLSYIGYKTQLVDIAAYAPTYELGIIKMEQARRQRALFESKDNVIFAAFQTAIPSLTNVKPAFGGMVGWGRRVGVYAKFLFSRGVRGEYMGENDAIYLSDTRMASYNYCGAGVVAKVWRPLYVYAGWGLNWSHCVAQSAMTGTYYSIAKSSYTKMGIDVGAMLNIWYFTLNLGVVYTPTEGCAANIGIGVNF